MKTLIIALFVLGLFACEPKDEKKCEQATFLYNAAIIAKDLACQGGVAAIDACDVAKAAVLFAQVNKDAACD